MAKKKKKTTSSNGKSSDNATGKMLVIVESPAKAKTINKYLGKDYVVRASKGHIRDLPPHAYGIDPARNFEPSYEIMSDSIKTIKELKKLSDAADAVYLATDLDREGEAIAWHLKHALELPDEKSHRVVFNEITKTAINDAFKKPHQINQSKVDAQQARRILDRIVGYELSPLLWKKISKGLSAGRVQSVAVRLIVIRENEIRIFEPQEYWVVDGAFSVDAAKAKQNVEPWAEFRVSGGKEGGAPTQKERYAWLSDRDGFEASLSELQGSSFKPSGKLDPSKAKGKMFSSAVDEMQPIAKALGVDIESVNESDWDAYEKFGLKKIEIVGNTDPDAAPEYRVKSIETKRTKSKPHAPFTTATLQQSAANVLRFNTSRIMRVAQSLYEGVDIKTGEGNVGLITYMRTDSRALSKESVASARAWIGDSLGDKYLPAKPNVYSSGKAAQEAHEAIRPTSVHRTPDELQGHLTAEQHKLYKLIWERFVSCQMPPAEWDSTTVSIAAQSDAGEAVFKLSGRVLVFDGFYRISGVPKSGDDQTLPELKEGQQVYPIGIVPAQKYTSPPARYTEAALVKTLEAEGIGRPSTYAAIIQTIQDRGYVDQEDRKFRPTARGEVVTEKLVEHFPKIMDINFTSHVEEELDKVEENTVDWHDVLHEFYDPFKESLAKANDDMEKVKAEASPYTCEECGEPMVYRLGKNGRFLSCSAYPKCKNAKNVDNDGAIIEPTTGTEPCEVCGKNMIVRKGRTGGHFLGCTGYPDCTNTLPSMEDGTPLRKVEADSLKKLCNECSNEMEVKWSRGKAFLGCTSYPKCKATEQLPPDVYVEKPKPEAAGARCDKCGRDMVIRKARRGPFLSCSGFPKCRNAMPTEKLDELKQMEADGKIPDPPPEPKPGEKKPAASRRKNLTKEEIAELGPAPKGFAWTRTGRPTVEVMPKDGVLTCFECGNEMRMRTGRFGPFFACTDRKCKAAANLRGEAKKQAEAESPENSAEPIKTNETCPECGKPMMLRMGQRGRFLACSGYPDCKTTKEPPPGMLKELAGAGA